MTVTKQKSSTEYTRVLETTTTTKTTVAEEEHRIISDEHNIADDRQSANEVNKSQNKFNFSENSVDSNSECRAPAERERLSNNNVKNNSLGFLQMNSTQNSVKTFVPFSEQTVAQNNRKEPTVSIHIESEPHISKRLSPESPNNNNSSTDSAKQTSPIRPTTLSVSPIPPEFSISPADSLSKASSSDNIPESSTPPDIGTRPVPNIQQLSAKPSLSSSKPPPSPTNLSVHNFNGSGSYFGWGASTPLALSPSFNSLHGSLASSINDLTVEAEQLERAIRHNDTRFVRRMLELHNKVVNTSYEKNDSLIDKMSRSSQNLDLDSNNPNKQLLKSQSMIEK